MVSVFEGIQNLKWKYKPDSFIRKRLFKEVNQCDIDVTLKKLFFRSISCFSRRKQIHLTEETYPL